MNVNFGLFPPMAGHGRDRRKLAAARALAAIEDWLGAERAAAE
jgi:hypothetical protein